MALTADSGQGVVGQDLYKASGGQIFLMVGCDFHTLE